MTIKDNGNDQTAINWYPGHMAKAHRQIREQLSLVDIVIELRDARMPEASANPMLGELSRNKPVLIILNKADLADADQNLLWKEHFSNCMILDSTADDLSRIVVKEVKNILKDKLEKAKARGIRKKVLRAMVVGIPNVGKSTFINAFVGKNVATTGNKPGVTKGKQWISINKELELLDTPGILWPKFEDQEVGRKLAYLGSINDEILVTEELAGDLLFQLYRDYPAFLAERYKITSDVYEGEGDSFSNPRSRMLDHIAKSRGCLKKGGEVDYFKTAGVVLDDFRSGRIGSITLERP